MKKINKDEVRFVYGTLKSGFGLHSGCGLDNEKIATLEGVATIKGYDMWSMGYPVVKRGTGTIFIEAYHIKSQEIRDRIDRIESGAGYCTEEITVTLENKKTITGSIYIYKGDTGRLEQIKSGVYK